MSVQRPATQLCRKCEFISRSVVGHMLGAINEFETAGILVIHNARGLQEKLARRWIARNMVKI